MSGELRLAWLLTRGSDRREGWRVLLTAMGAGLATGLALAAAAVASLHGQYDIALANGLLNYPGERAGSVLTLLLLLVPVLGFLAQCARIGAVHRDRRLARLRLAGAAPGQVRRIAALEAGLACLGGSVLATVVAVPLLLLLWPAAPALLWVVCALLTAAVPVLGALASVVALRRVVAEPLGRVGRVRPRAGRGPGPLLPLVASGLLVAGILVAPSSYGGFDTAPALVLSVVIGTGVCAVWLSGVTSRRIGRRLAERTGDPAVLIAAERLRDEPRTAARTHAAVLLVTVVGTGFMGVRQVLLETLHERGAQSLAMDVSFYITGIDLTGAALGLALVITLCGLAMGTAESLATRRRGLAAQAAAGVPAAVLTRALLLETALPLAPSVALAGLGGMGVAVWYALLADTAGTSLPLIPLLVPVVAYAACLLAAATSLPLLRRSLSPSELRHA
ncbi:FtsX-like permease family protein [Streptomyces gibsoniae]|uniref:ABC transporter permease n=1 Tax=Streptomyces gibsoniae TaxID=3075529 RepID=A0ABU2TXJ2_9ACTN|nr:FtsX-like permease family protein [Streptomyces sp. DSM 41699]MDT0465537.1 ABC transporter permease [Streptomyces sp. DSM 41699]